MTFVIVGGLVVGVLYGPQAWLPGTSSNLEGTAETGSGHRGLGLADKRRIGRIPAAAGGAGLRTHARGVLQRVGRFGDIQQRPRAG